MPREYSLLHVSPSGTEHVKKITKKEFYDIRRHVKEHDGKLPKDCHGEGIIYDYFRIEYSGAWRKFLYRVGWIPVSIIGIILILLGALLTVLVVGIPISVYGAYLLWRYAQYGKMFNKKHDFPIKEEKHGFTRKYFPCFMVFFQSSNYDDPDCYY